MQRIFFMCFEAALSAVILIPLLLILNKFYFHSAQKTIRYFVFAIYLSAVYAVVGMPSVNFIRFSTNCNIIPFAYMFSDYKNSLLNILLFLPLGFFLTTYWNSFRKLHRTLFFGFCMSLLIELLQLFTFRATDINDLITNTLGTIFGWILGRICLKLFPSTMRSRRTAEVYWLCCLVFFVMFFLQPLLSAFVSAYMV